MHIKAIPFPHSQGQDKGARKYNHIVTARRQGLQTSQGPRPEHTADCVQAVFLGPVFLRQILQEAYRNVSAEIPQQSQKNTAVTQAGAIRRKTAGLIRHQAPLHNASDCP